MPIFTPTEPPTVPPATTGSTAPATAPCFKESVTGDIFGNIPYFNGGNILPAGTYRVQYEGGCFKFGVSQDWTVHASTSANFAWRLEVGSSRTETVVRLPGTIGISAESGAFTDFASCVEGNLALDPIEFILQQDSPLGIFLSDTFDYSDNVEGVDGENPSWEVTNCL